MNKDAQTGAGAPRVTKALRRIIERRWASGAAQPLFAGPLRTMVQWEAWR